MADAITIARFLVGSSHACTAPLWAYDYGQTLSIEGIDLPSVFEVHFANEGDATTKTELGESGQVHIPDEYLRTGKKINAFIYLHAGENDGETEYKITIPVKARPEPSDTPPTPVEQDVIREAMAALNTQTGLAEAAAIVAEEAAVRAEEAAASIDEDMVADAVAEYLDDHPVTVTEEDPTVPSWAKQPSKPTYTASEVGAASEDDLAAKVDKVTGKGLSENDFTDALKSKLDGIEAGAQVNPDLTHYVTDSDYNPASKTSGMTQSVGVDSSGKLWTAPGGSGGTSDYADLTNKPQIAGVTLSGNKSLADLGIAAASDIPSVPVQSVNGKTGAVSLDAEDVGAYVKPSGGIPSTDLATGVQTSLGKADTALQTETDPTVPSWAKAQSKPSYTASEVGAIAAPSSPSSGQFLQWNGSAWVAASLPLYNGGVS